MLIDRLVFSLSGVMILTCVALGYLVSPRWLLGAAIVSLNLVQAGMSGFCPIAMTLRRLGFKSASVFV